VLALCANVLGFLGRYLPFVNRPVQRGDDVAIPDSHRPGIGLLLGPRCWLLASAAGAVTAAAIATQIPLYVADTGIRLEVMSANLRLGDADAESWVSFVGEHVKVLTVQKLTPAEPKRLSWKAWTSSYRTDS
jgi:hypothetical protein